MINFESLFTRKAHNEGAEVRIIGHDGKFTDFYILVMGVDSDAWRNRKKESTVQETLADMTLGWRGINIEFSPEMAKTLYTEAPYIADQVATFFYNRENFTRPANQSL